jgi:iron complex outermembrane receptor protein
VGLASEKRLLDNPSSVSLLTAEDFHRNNDVNLQNTLNLVPGVMMNVRSSSSQSNILIRGIGTYSRFSIRGVKVYLNGIPVTDADGTTTLDDIDFTTLGRAEIVRGPASSIYGASLGGVVLLGTKKAPYGVTSVGQSVMAGSYGLLRTNTTFQSSGDNASAYVDYGHQQVKGYRDHSSSLKNFATVASDFFLSDRQSVSILANYSHINDDYAGELDSLTFRTEPTQAFAPYINKDIGLAEELTRLGISHSYSFSPDFSNVTSVFTTGVTKVSPVEPRYSRSAQTKYGGRTVFTYQPQIGGIGTRFDLGAEFNANYNVSKAYKISDSGAAGAIIGDNEVNAYQTNAFLQAQAEIMEKTSLVAGASYNVVRYRNLDMLKPNLSGTVDFDPAVTPRVALIHTFGDKISLFAQASGGFSPPIASQITLTGVNLPSYINTDLKPERSMDYELGSRGSLLDDRLSYDVTLYTMSVTDALIQQTVSGVTAFVNAGKTSYTGVEASLGYAILAEGDLSGISSLRPWVTYTYNKSKFEDYKIGTNDYTGNKVTGVVPSLLNAGLDLATSFGVYLDLTYQYVDKMPIKDDNSLYSDAYSLLNAKAGYRVTLGDHIGGEVMAGVDNLTDTRYSGTLALNAADKRYYAPAPGRSVYGGLTVNYLF